MQTGHWAGSSPWRRSPILVVAAANGATNIARLLLNAGARIDAEVEEQWVDAGGPRSGWVPQGTALLAAASAAHVDTVEMLLQRGARARLQQTLAHVAESRFGVISERSRIGKLAIAKLLLDHGALPDADALLWAVWARRVDMLALLLEYGADPNAADSNGAIALVNALMHGDTEMSQLLIDKGATPPTKGVLHALSRAAGGRLMKATFAALTVRRG